MARNKTELVTALRLMLKDNHPTTAKRRFTDTELEMYLEDAILDINVQPPAFTNYTFTTWGDDVPEWEGLILQGGTIFSLIAEGIFNIGIEFTYNDNGISVSIERSGKYQSMVSMLLQNYTQKKERVKQQFWFERVSPHAMISAPMPIRFRSFTSRIWRYR